MSAEPPTERGDSARLPLLLSVPHAGLAVPPRLGAKCAASLAEIEADGDVGAKAIYDLSTAVEGFVTTSVARAVLDMNRAVDDFRKDGVVKTHTCWDVPVWRDPLTPAEVADLLATHHEPYHRELSSWSRDGKRARIQLAVDCHTMAAVGPPVGPDSGQERPSACLGDGGGQCPPPIVEAFQRSLSRHLPGRVTVNDPFGGGYITRSHGSEMPWIQLELSRAPFLTDIEKRAAVLAALEELCRDLGWCPS